MALAIGRDYSDVSPMRGVLHGGARHTLSVGVTVRPLEELRAEAAQAAQHASQSQTADPDTIALQDPDKEPS